MVQLIEFIALSVCSLAALALGGYWGAVGFHALRTLVMIPTARKGLRLAERRERKPWPTVCVVVPAHNEAGCVGLLAKSLVGQDYPNLTAVFALDRCTDGTAAAVRAQTGHDERFEIIEVSSCPPDWAGKVNAIWRAVKDSHAAPAAEVLLFADADTVFEPGCVRACVALMESRELGMLSLLSTMTTGQWFEKVVQPVAGMELIRQYPIVRANSATHRRPFANGQFLMIRREAYEKLGGHESVRSALLEDIELARLAHWHGVTAGMFLARGMMHCRMYGSWVEFRRGWKRIYTESTKRKSRRMRTQARRVRLLGVYLPTLSAIGLAGGLLLTAPAAPIALWTGVVGLGLWLLVLALCYAIGSTPVIYVPAYPIGAWCVGAILREAARDLERGVKTVWGGREYMLADRDD